VAALLAKVIANTRPESVSVFDVLFGHGLLFSSRLEFRFRLFQ